MNRYLVTILCLLFFTGKIKAQEENVIALMIYNFTRYIDWPKEQASSDFFIDIIGHKSVYDKLKELAAGRKVGNRNIAVRYLESVNNISHSQILFVGYWQSKDFPKAIEKIGNTNTLIITEKDGYLDIGSGINFVIRNNTIKFEIKKGNIQKYGLVVSEGLEPMAIKSY
jgi:YfiR/HmsC-like